MSKFFIICLLVTSNLSFGADEMNFDTFWAKEVEFIDALVSDLSKLNVTDGVSLKEANVIVEAIYYSKYGDGCGAPGEITDDGKFWKVPTSSGFSANPDAPLYIDKKTGEVSRRNSILILNPKEIDLVMPYFYKKYKSKT
jgi:hypothetical protein